MLKLISADSRASESAEKDGNAFLGDSGRLCIRTRGGVRLFPRR